MNGLNAQRYNTAHRLRHECASILGVAETDLLKPDVRKNKFRDQIGWVNETGLYSSGGLSCAPPVTGGFKWIQVDSTGFHLNICINLAEKKPIFKWIQVDSRSNF